MERLLVSKINEFLQHSGRRVEEVLTVEIVSYLQTTYPQFKRTKYTALKKAVEVAVRSMKRLKKVENQLNEDATRSSQSNQALRNLYTPPPKMPKIVDTPSEENVPAKKRKLSSVSDIKEKFFVPVVTFKHFGGSNHILRKISQFFLNFLGSSCFENMSLTAPCGLLVTGPIGCGKTHLVNCISGEFQIKMLKVCCTELICSLSGDSENKIREIFDLCKSNSPCILFLDDIEVILQKREVSSKQMEQRIVSQFMHCLDDLTDFATTNQNSKVLVIGTATTADVLDPALRRAGRFDTEICLGMPNIDDRVEILKLMCSKVTLESSVSLDNLAILTPGYVGADLKGLIREATLHALLRSFGIGECKSNSIYGPEYEVLKSNIIERGLDADVQKKALLISQADFEAAVNKVQPSSKREGFITVPSVKWDDVGALHEIRKELQLAIVYPVKHRHLFKAFNLSLPPGILLAGPPGCGKTLLAKAVANEAGINFISVKGPELLNMYLGESERAVRQVFSRAKNSSPCVIFFDEIDALCPKRKDSDHGGSRVVQQFLTELDGVESREGVFILAATNRPDVIDSAMLRPGRFDKVLNVQIPTADDRYDILKALTKDGTQPKLDSSVSLHQIALDERCKNFSGADLSALIREASISALEEVLKSFDGATFGPPSMIDNVNLVSACFVSHRHFNNAFEKVKSSVEKSDFVFSKFFSK